VDRTRKILLDRLRQLDVGRPTVTTTGAGTLRVTAAHADAERAKSVLVPGSLTFRHVLNQTPDRPAGDCKADGTNPAEPDGALARPARSSATPPSRPLPHFTAAGQRKWTALSQDALNEQVAVLLDNAVIPAPTIQAVITGDASISGGDLSTRAGATALAATLGHGVLPLRVTATATDTVR
jgi:preprotein translocase subunit SecD